jgi:hypothetical protein
MVTTARLRKITLHLARSKEFPDGSIRHGYEFVAPLDKDGHIDAEGWRSQRNACIVHRFWSSETRQRGLLVHKAGGAKGARWGFDYDMASDADDEAGFRFGDHAFAVGEYVSINDAEGVMHTFTVVSVSPA